MEKNQLFYWIYIILLCIGTNALAQKHNNPFELHGRTTIEETTSVEGSTVLSSSNVFELRTDSVLIQDTVIPSEVERDNIVNPFEIGDNNSIVVKGNKEEAQNPFDISKQPTVIVDKTTINQKAKQSKPNVFKPLTGMFRLWFLVVLITVFTLMITLYGNIIQKIYRSFTNSNFLKMVQREQSGALKLPYLVLFIFSCFSIGGFSFLTLNTFKQPLPVSNFSGVFIIGGLVLSFFIAKYFVTNLIGKVFSISKITSRYLFLILVAITILGLVLVPFNLLLISPIENITSYINYIGITVVIIILAFLILRSLLLANKYISLHPFHFFVYLCTIEIAPILVLLKFGGVL